MSKGSLKFVRGLGSIGIGETHLPHIDDKIKIEEVFKDNIAKTCILILSSLTNNDMKVISQNPEIDKTFEKFNTKVKMFNKMDSIVINQLCYGNSVIFYDVAIPKIMVYDSSTFDIVYDPRIDEFQGIYQKIDYYDPEELKRGIKIEKQFEKFIKNKSLILIPGIGKGHGESLILPAYRYVNVKNELIENLPDLVKRLGLLTIIGVDLPGDIGESDVDEYLSDIETLVNNSLPNSFWVLPKETRVDGVRGSGEARVIESVKTIVDLLDEEIRKCTFVPDTFLSSLSANRATAKEQRYLISSMVNHIRGLIEESLVEMYDNVLIYNGFVDFDYEFTWGNINLPEPEALFDFIMDSKDRDILTVDEVRTFLNMGNREMVIEDESGRDSIQPGQET